MPDDVGAAITISLRPERVHVGSRRPEGAGVAIPGRVIHRAFYGETIHCYLEPEGRTDPLIASVTNFERADRFEIGDAVWPGCPWERWLPFASARAGSPCSTCPARAIRASSTLIEKHGSAPGIFFFADGHEGFNKLRSGFKADLADPRGGLIGKMRAADLIKPIDTARLKAWDELLPTLAQLPEVSSDGQVWMLPFD